MENLGSGWVDYPDSRFFCIKWHVKNHTIKVFAHYEPDQFGLIHFVGVEADVYIKRKRVDESLFNCECTGKLGLKPLLDIRKSLFLLEEFLKDNQKVSNNFRIIIHWTDSRRRDAYFYGLKDYGYSFGSFYNVKVLQKVIN